MPRTIAYQRCDVTLPCSILEAIRRASELEQVPSAEMIRRAVDFTLTLKDDYRAVHIPATNGVKQNFAIHLPRRMIEWVTHMALEEGCEPDELMRRAIHFYFTKKIPLWQGLGLA